MTPGGDVREVEVGLRSFIEVKYGYSDSIRLHRRIDVALAVREREVKYFI